MREREREQATATPFNNQLSGKALGGERQQAVSGNALDHSDIFGLALNGERQMAVSGKALDHSTSGQIKSSAIRVGPQR